MPFVGSPLFRLSQRGCNPSSVPYQVTGKPGNPGLQLLRTRSREINSRPPWRGTRRLFVRTRNNPFPYSAAEPARAPRQNLCSSTFLTLLPCRIVLANNPPRIETQHTQPVLVRRKTE